MILNFKIIVNISLNHMVIYIYMKTYNMIFCEINNPSVMLYTILIFCTYYLIIQNNNILISIKNHLISHFII